MVAPNREVFRPNSERIRLVAARSGKPQGTGGFVNRGLHLHDQSRWVVAMRVQVVFRLELAM